jgi:hypothetical protein
MRGSTPKQKIEVIIDGDNDHEYLKDEEEEDMLKKQNFKHNENKVEVRHQVS